MHVRGDGARYWFATAGLLLFAAYSTQKVIRAHVDPSVASIDYEFERDVQGRRGSIRDANGKPLAMSVPVWEYRLDPVALTNRVVRRNRKEAPRPPNSIVKTIATALKRDYRELLKLAHTGHGRYIYLTQSTDPEAHRILADSSLVSGVVIEDRQVRQYVHRRHLSHVLGSVNAEGVGSAGLELKYNRQLSGVPGRVKGMKDACGRELYDKRIVSIPPVPGVDIRLTVDLNLQYEAESALADGIREYGAGSGWCIILDARNAAVLAMASWPDFEPIRFGSASPRETVNRAVAFTYEPGSVMKVITASAAIDSGFAGPNKLYSTARHDERYYKLPGDGSHKWEPTMTVKDAIVHSSNIVIGKLGYDMGPAKVWTYMKRFGFGERTGIELPGEEVGILRPWKKWDKATWSRAPIGQAVSVTAIQLASAYQAIANDGVRMRPHIISRMVGADGTDVYRHVDAELGRPISTETSRTMRSVMLGVAAKGGTARRAAIKGYSVAGKTGTAQKAIGGHYAPGLYRATFCGIVPAGVDANGRATDSPPRVVVLVSLDFDACTKFHQGGNSAGPVFRRLTGAALRYLEVPPDRPDETPELDDEDEIDSIIDARSQKYGIISP